MEKWTCFRKLLLRLGSTVTVTVVLNDYVFAYTQHWTYVHMDIKCEYNLYAEFVYYALMPSFFHPFIQNNWGVKRPTDF